MNQRQHDYAPLVDIILPTFNGEKYLPELLDSIANQSYKNFRLLVRDDASSDKSAKLLKSCHFFPQKNIYISSNDENIGVVHNINKLLMESSASYVMFADQDDVWLKDKITMSLQEIKRAEAQFGVDTPIVVFTDAYVGDENLVKQANSLLEFNGYFGYSSQEDAMQFRNLMVQNLISGCTMVINIALKKRMLPIPAGVIMHDWWIMLVASAMGRTIFMADKTMVYRIHQNNTLGLREASLLKGIWSVLKSPLQAKGRVSESYKQARIFQDIYFDILSRDVRLLLIEYTDLPSLNIIHKWWRLWRNNFRKSSISKTIGFYLLS